MNNNDYLSIFEVICFMQNVTSLNEIKNNSAHGVDEQIERRK